MTTFSQHMDCAPVIKAKRNHMDLKISFASISSYGVLNFKCCAIIFMNVVIIEAFFSSTTKFESMLLEIKRIYKIISCLLHHSIPKRSMFCRQINKFEPPPLSPQSWCHLREILVFSRHGPLSSLLITA